MKRSILVVDDQASTRDLLRLILEFDGFEVYEAEGGEEALELIPEIKPDVLILDVMMPGMDGFTTCRRLRSMEDSMTLPVIMLSAKTDQEAIDEGLKAGANLYLPKPISRQALLENIRILLSSI